MCKLATKEWVTSLSPGTCIHRCYLHRLKFSRSIRSVVPAVLHSAACANNQPPTIKQKHWIWRAWHCLLEQHTLFRLTSAVHVQTGRQTVTKTSYVVNRAVSVMTPPIPWWAGHLTSRRVPTTLAKAAMWCEILDNSAVQCHTRQMHQAILQWSVVEIKVKNNTVIMFCCICFAARNRVRAWMVAAAVSLLCVALVGCAWLRVLYEAPLNGGTHLLACCDAT